MWWHVAVENSVVWYERVGRRTRQQQNFCLESWTQMLVATTIDHPEALPSNSESTEETTGGTCCDGAQRPPTVMMMR